ncbi:Ppx/GppA family phosphatase [Peribacillus kribbensis]|uniref:Ppx/GppA family phosphatase n=1 Tax=Peribacillus kribbensis TaxID=356658 RepID=UPI0003F89D6B|nr:Ppx/GppA family phosphatase [Peribacillus kribbensis]
MKNKHAIIDIGSNTIRLVIYHIHSSGRIRKDENVKVSARLQTHLDESKMLSQAGLKILLDTLSAFKDVIALQQAALVKVIATAAIRQASNKAEIIEKIFLHTGFSVEILSGDREAYYGFKGVVQSTSLADGITVDIGGGSTEITEFKNREMIHSYSFPFGVLSLKQKFIKSKIPSGEELLHLSNYLNSELKKAGWLYDSQKPIIGIGGSARSIGSIWKAKTAYPVLPIQQFQMSEEDIKNVRKDLLSKNSGDLLETEGLSKERVDIIFPAIEVFLAIFSVTRSQLFEVSQKGIREGVLHENIIGRLQIPKKKTMAEKSIREIAARFGQDIEKGIQSCHTARLLVEKLNLEHLTSDRSSFLSLINYSCLLYGLGNFIDSDFSDQHTFYLLTNLTINGLSLRDRIKTALVASFSSNSSFKSRMKPFKEWFSKQERMNLRVLGAIVKLAFSLNITKRNIVEGIELAAESNNTMLLMIYCNKSWIVEKQEADKQIRHLEKSMRKTIEIEFKHV